MACFSPLKAYSVAGGGVVFAELGRHDITGTLDLPCGRCNGCLAERARQWMVRCTHEASLHERNCFVTLTYSDAELPPGGSLRGRDVTLFIKRLRHHYPDQPFRYFLCGEYGERLGRPHYHICLFGLDFEDKRYIGKTQSGHEQFESQILSLVWRRGLARVSAFTPSCAAYTARYILQKHNGPESEAKYQKIDPHTGEVFQLEKEFNRASRNPAIGFNFLRLYWPSVAERGTVVVDGREQRAPRYYDKVLRKLGAMDEVEHRRFLTAQAQAEHTSPERLAVRAKVHDARMKTKKRHTQEFV